MNNVEQYLKDRHIEYVFHKHPAVYTCEEAKKYCGDVPGLASKNLLLKNREGKRYFLIILPAVKRADLKKISELVGEKKVSFASAENLKEKLDLEPGSVSPFGLLNDKNHEVEVCVDEEVENADIVSFHPNINTASLELTGEMFRKFLESLENKIYIIK
jgi:Ala-tRNA(Pro) deacylase